MNYQTINFESKDAIGVLTFNRPERMNAINYLMRDELRDFFISRLTDTETRVLIVTGSGKGFCSGLDIKDSKITKPENNYTPKLAYELQQLFSDIIVFMRRCPQPIIGAINGAAVGAGLSIAMACDLRLAAPEAKFSAAYINIGTGGADMGSSWLFTRAVGLGNSSRYLLTGDFFNADEAYRIGFVQAIVAKEKLMDEGLALAKNMAGKSPLGLRLTKEALDRNVGAASLEDAIKLEDRNQALCISQLAAQATLNRNKD